MKYSVPIKGKNERIEKTAYFYDMADRKTEQTISKMEQVDEPKTQIKTQNSNLTFEKDECAKEYEELGLKELKELIEADRKDENSSEIPNNCDTCRNKGFEGCEQPCLGCGCCGLYEPKDEPQTDDKHAVCTGCDYYDLPNTFHPCASCVDFSKYKPKIEDEPQTDCAWK